MTVRPRTDDAANALDAACGWRRVDEVLLQLRDGPELRSDVWVAS